MKALCTAACTLVLGSGGDVATRHEPGLPAADPVERASAPPGQVARARAGARRAAAASAARGGGVLAELRRMRDGGEITPEDFRERRRVFKDAKAFAGRATGRRRVEMTGVVRNLQGIALRGDLAASRLPALWLGLQRNREWWSTGPLLGGGQRVSFTGSELVFQYFPGQGLQFHPLANFGKLNALWRSGRNGRLEQLYDELAALAAQRAGGLAWEYSFWFDGGRPPWVSGMAQGTALQAVSRAGERLERRRPGGREEALALARAGLGVFRTDAPAGVRRATPAGNHYLIYSYAPRLLVINGFLQALVGLHDYATISGDPEARALFEAGDRRARVELPRFDTGAWSLYSRGSSRREASLHYHELTRDFLQSLCDRLVGDAYCPARERFDSYLAQPPVVALRTRQVRAGSRARLRLDLSKISRVSVRIRQGRRQVFARTGLTLGRGTRTLSWKVPRRAGKRTWTATATDLAGNTAAASGRLRVIAPRRRR
jgi:hypothetical protein